MLKSFMPMASNILSKLVQAAAITVLLMGTAAAQVPMSLPLGETKHYTPEEIERQKAIDRAYKAATDKIPEKKTSNDPWATVRPAPDPPKVSKNKQ
jgi:hypothetical protein